MRGQLIVGKAIVREIRPIDVIQTIDRLLFNSKEGSEITDEQWSAALFTDSDLIEGEINDEVNAAFSFVNRAYLKSDFIDSTTHKKSTLNTRKLTALQNTLMNECAVLVGYNHSQCWTYGWAFFRFVQELYQKK